MVAQVNQVDLDELRAKLVAALAHKVYPELRDRWVRVDRQALQERQGDQAKSDAVNRPEVAAVYPCALKALLVLLDREGHQGRWDREANEESRLVGRRTPQ